MRNRAVRCAECLIGLAIMAGASNAASAQDIETGLDVSAGVGVESNPYNEIDPGGVQVAATAQLEPRMRIRDEQTTINLNGLASFRQFFRKYGLEDNYAINGNIVTRATEQLTLRSNAGYSYNESGYGGFGRPGLSPLDPTLPVSELPDPILIDPAILGRRTRIRSLNLGVGADARIDTVSSLSFDLNGMSQRFRLPGLYDFNNVVAQLAYTYRLSEDTTVGVTGSASRADYLNRRIGDGRTYSIMGTINHRLDERWTLSGGVGVARTKTNQGFGLPDADFTSLTGNARACRQGEYDQFCIGGSRSPQPSANGGVRVTNALDVSYSRRLSETENVRVAGSYARTGRGRGIDANLPATSFVSAVASYDKRINERMTAFVSGSFSRIHSPLVSSQTNLGLNAGVRVSFGALR